MNHFTAKTHSFPLTRTYIMGILNVTPDSFSDGGRYLDPEKALARALEMERQGADIIDIGGQSTRPGFETIPPDEEWERIRPVLEAVANKTSAAISVDTFYPEVAEKALKAGAHIINDVSGFGDAMLQAVSASDCGCVIMHPRGAERGDILREVRDFFEERLARAANLGIDPDRLCFDPGIGFGKTHEDNLRLIANVDKTKLPGVAYLMAASRKRVTGIPCGSPPFEERLPATLAAHTAAVLGGADILRVHDVPEALQAARMADALKTEKQTER